MTTVTARTSTCTVKCNAFLRPISRHPSLYLTMVITRSPSLPSLNHTCELEEPYVKSNNFGRQGSSENSSESGMVQSMDQPDRFHRMLHVVKHCVDVEVETEPLVPVGVNTRGRE